MLLGPLYFFCPVLHCFAENFLPLGEQAESSSIPSIIFGLCVFLLHREANSRSHQFYPLHLFQGPMCKPETYSPWSAIMDVYIPTLNGIKEGTSYLHVQLLIYDIPIFVHSYSPIQKQSHNVEHP